MFGKVFFVFQVIVENMSERVFILLTIGFRFSTLDGLKDKLIYGVHYCSKHFDDFLDVQTPLVRLRGRITVPNITT